MYEERGNIRVGEVGIVSPERCQVLVCNLELALLQLVVDSATTVHRPAHVAATTARLASRLAASIAAVLKP